MEYSKYQKGFFNFLTHGKGNGVVNAVAGSGKSFSIIHALPLLKGKDSCVLAFNKHIVCEMREKLKKANIERVVVKTMHSLAMSVLMRKYNIALNQFTVTNKVKDWGDAKNWDEEYRNTVKEIIHLIYVTCPKNLGELKYNLEKHNIFPKSDEINRSYDIFKQLEANKKEANFDAFLYRAAKWNVTLPKFDFVFVDECQDLNRAQQLFMFKLLKPNTGRFIAVGDPKQAIYGFTGADVESFNRLVNMPNTTKLPLNETFRCGSNIVKKAQEIVPYIESWNGAGDGVVNDNAKLSEIKVGDLVLCRTNAPIVQLCLNYISKGVQAKIIGRDIKKTLSNFVLKVKTEKQIKEKIPVLWETVVDYMQRKVDEVVYTLKKNKAYEKLDLEELKELPSYKSIVDKKLIIETIYNSLNNEEAKTPVISIVEKINTIFNNKQGGIMLSTVHRAKGLEADRVFIVEPDILPAPWVKLDWQKTQEENLHYVAITRAKQYLGYVRDWTFYKKKNTN